MRVADLRLLLEMLPDDMLVCVGGRRLAHVAEVSKEPRRRIQGVAGEGPVEVPALVRLEPGVVWYDPEPSFVIRGRWPRPRAADGDLESLLDGGGLVG